jgi:hypothetical protein
MEQGVEMRTAVAALYVEACNGREDALRFMVAFNQLAHAVDNLVDEKQGAEALFQVLTMEQSVMSCGFYREHEAELRLVWTLVRNGYADSLALREERITDVIRFAGNEMVRAVAFICGGWELLRKLSPLLWASSWLAHHAGDGKGGSYAV